MEVTLREEKRRPNPREHGLDFALAEAVLADPLAVTVFDRVEDGEESWHTVGAIPSSLRAADPGERRHYEISRFWRQGSHPGANCSAG